MQFKYDSDVKQKEPKVRAIIDKDGDLLILDTHGNDHALLTKSGCILTRHHRPNEDRPDESSLKDAQRVFFEGDEITIKF